MEPGPLEPQVGYGWVQGDPRITPGWTDPGKFRKIPENSGKTRKFWKIRNLLVTYQIKALGKLGKLVHPNIYRPKSDHPRVSWKASHRLVRNEEVVKTWKYIASEIKTYKKHFKWGYNKNFSKWHHIFFWCSLLVDRYELRDIPTDDMINLSGEEGLPSI